MVADVLFVYILLVHLAAPFAFAVLLWRGLRDRAYWERLGERFGYTRVRFESPPIWIHAVSVGEVQAAAIFIRRLQNDFPARPILVTTATVTGAARVRDLFAGHVQHCYLPYDLPGAVGRFLRRVEPQSVIVFETELWPVLFRRCIRRGTPVIFASARVSERSTQRYKSVGKLFTNIVANSLVAAQSEPDAERFRRLGATRVAVTGNIKFDLQVAPEIFDAGRRLRRMIGETRPVWIAGSTHDGEEAAVLETHDRVLQALPTAVLVLVPRHPQRFDAVRSLLAARHSSFATRSSGADVKPENSVLFVDTLGELLTFYAASDVAFVGGSLVPIGGHNLLEPAALGLQVITGPHNFNAPDIARRFEEREAIFYVHSAQELAEVVTAALQQPERSREFGRRARAVLEENRGALEKLLSVVRPALGEPR